MHAQQVEPNGLQRRHGILEPGLRHVTRLHEIFGKLVSLSGESRIRPSREGDPMRKDPSQHPVVRLQRRLARQHQSNVRSQHLRARSHQSPARSHHPIARLHRSLVGVQRTRMNAHRPAVDVHQPAVDVHRPVGDVQKALGNHQRPVVGETPASAGLHPCGARTQTGRYGSATTVLRVSRADSAHEKRPQDPSVPKVGHGPHGRKRESELFPIESPHHSPRQHPHRHPESSRSPSPSHHWSAPP